MPLKDLGDDFMRGEQSEQNAQKALEKLLKDNIILSFRKTERGSPDDFSGIDFYFSMEIKGYRVEAPLQVKSSESGIRKHYQKMNLIHAVNGQAPDLRAQIESIVIEYQQALGNGEVKMTEYLVFQNGIVPVFEARPDDGHYYTDVADIHKQLDISTHYTTWTTKYMRKLGFYWGKEIHQISGQNIGSVRKFGFMVNIHNALKILDYIGESKSGLFQYLQRFKGLQPKPTMQPEEPNDLKRHPHIELVKEEEPMVVAPEVLQPLVEIQPMNPADVLFEIKDGKVWVSSLEIARLFEREHKSVLTAIRSLEIDTVFAEQNFLPGSYRDSNNQERPMFMMTKKGYRRLVMDFTGDRAKKVKEQLLDRFEELEEKENKPQPLQLSGNIADMLQLAADQLRQKDLVIMEKEQKLLTTQEEKQNLEVVANQLALDNITARALFNEEHLIGLREAAKIFKLFGDDPKPLTVIRAMNELGWIYKLGKDSPNLPKSTLEAKGYFKTVMPKCNGEEREQAKLTPKGMQWAYPKLCAHFERPLNPLVQEYIQNLITQQFGDTPPAA